MSFRLQAPPGYDAQVRKLIATLLSSGGNVVSVDLSATPKAQTTVQIYDSDLAAAQQTNDTVFSTVTVETATVRLAGVDETISLGTDYLKAVDLNLPDATSTSLVA